MGMTITRYEKTIIPQTLEGKKFANDYEKILTKQGVFRGREEDTQAIVIKTKYCYTFTGEIEDGNEDKRNDY